MGSDSDYSEEKLKNLLTNAKVTQQSIQKVSQWLLLHRGNLSDAVEVWYQILQNSKDSLKIVCLYIANDTIQVGLRKYGKSIAAAFEVRLLDATEYIMSKADEKVKRCLIKLVGIWKSRKVIDDHVLNMVQNVCAGRPAVDHSILNAAVESVKQSMQPDNIISDDQAHEERMLMLASFTSEQVINDVIQDMTTDVRDSESTKTTSIKIEELGTATINADLLSDRMFQLEQNLNTFQQACETDEISQEDETIHTGCKIAWEQLEQQIFDLDIVKSGTHVQMMRDNLEEQIQKRSELIAHLYALKKAPLFNVDDILQVSQSEHDNTVAKLEAFYHICGKAEPLATEKAKQNRFSTISESTGTSGSYNSNDYHYNSRVSNSPQRNSMPPYIPHSSYPSINTSSYSNSYQSEQYHTNTYARSPRLERRHSSYSDPPMRYNEESNRARYSTYDDINAYSGQSKRPKLNHSQSFNYNSPSSSDRPGAYPRSRWEPRRDHMADDHRGIYTPSNSDRNNRSNDWNTYSQTSHRYH